MIHFILVPDRGAARRLRRVIAETGGAFGISVGTWPELIERLRVSYLVPPPSIDWDEALRDALTAMTGAPWFESYMVASIETARAISSTLREVIETAFGGPRMINAEAILEASNKFEGRTSLHLRALADLWQRLGTALPEDIRIAIHILKSSVGLHIEDVRVIASLKDLRLTPFQRRLIDVLTPEANDARATIFQDLLKPLDVPACSSTESALFHIATNLFYESKTDVVTPDASFQILAVRDAREEADVAASMAQDLLRAEPGLSAADIGVLVPSNDTYGDAVRDAFTLASLPLSGISTGQRSRDIGREYVRHFLSCRQRLAPVMALAAFVTSPLAPWPEATGRAMASMVMNGNFDLANAQNIGTAGREIVSLLRTDDETATRLGSALIALSRHLNSDQSFKEMVAAARDAIALLQSKLPAAGTVDVNELARLVSPTTQTIDDIVFWQDAVTVFAEDTYPWKQVKHLIVLGASSGSYPTGPFTSPVFNEQERQELRQKIELTLPTAEDSLFEGRLRFLAQLRAASRSLTIFVPERDFDGNPLAPSESLAFIARLFGCELQTLILRLALPTDRTKACFVPVGERPAPASMIETQAKTFEIGTDLLSLRKDKEGKPRPQSPSRLETLLVSPLAFVLEELGAVPDEWAPEDADPALRGTLAHAAFEELFKPDQPIPDAKVIHERLPSVFETNVRRIAPFFFGSAWSVERQTLEREIETAAIAWSELLRAENARMIGREFMLSGLLDGVPIHGKADALIGLGKGAFLIVDFKKAGSAKRRQRMEAGFDIQLPLYRLMATNGKLDGLAEDLTTAVQNAPKVGIAYFMLNDGQALSDKNVDLGTANSAWRAIAADISAQAMPIVRRRLAELRKGSIERDTMSWLKQLEKPGNVGLYARDKSPLISRFTLDDSQLPGGGDNGEA